MNNNIIKGLLGLCGILFSVLLIEWQMTGFSGQAKVDGNGVEEEPRLVVELPRLIIAKQSMETYSQMVESPLFIKGRKPIAEDNKEDVEVESSGKIDDLILLGIYSIKDDMKALFSTTGGGEQYLKRAEGQDVNGWLLKEIKPDQVIMEQRGKVRTIDLRSPKPSSKLNTKIKAIKKLTRALRNKLKPKS